jgi:chitodextrinase
MSVRHAVRAVVGIAVLSMLLAVAFTAPTASAQLRDRTPPTTPTNLRVTATTPYSISLAWSPSTDNSARFSYAIQASHGPRLVADHPTTTYKLDFGLSPGQTYSFFVYAFDRAGNRSGNSNTVSATTPRDTTPPTTPTLSLVSVAPTEVSLRWTSSTDNASGVGYRVFKNGNPVLGTDLAPSGTGNASVVVRNLTPSTTYTFTVQASDQSGNVSPHSNAVTVTTQGTGGRRLRGVAELVGLDRQRRSAVGDPLRDVRERGAGAGEQRHGLDQHDRLRPRQRHQHVRSAGVRPGGQPVGAE